MLWGWVLDQGEYFGVGGRAHLIAIFDLPLIEVPILEQLSSTKSIVPPGIVNNLGFSKGYWRVEGNVPLPETFDPSKIVFYDPARKRQVLRNGAPVLRNCPNTELPLAAFGSYNSMHYKVLAKLEG
jgi:hypothetical protein